jgi:hypothetical protein
MCRLPPPPQTFFPGAVFFRLWVRNDGWLGPNPALLTFKIVQSRQFVLQVVKFVVDYTFVAFESLGEHN